MLEGGGRRWRACGRGYGGVSRGVAWGSRGGRGGIEWDGIGWGGGGGG